MKDRAASAGKYSSETITQVEHHGQSKIHRTKTKVEGGNG
jgi:hypothetical protein